MKQYLYKVQILGEHGLRLDCLLPWDSEEPLRAANLEHEIRRSDIWEDKGLSLECFEGNFCKTAVGRNHYSVRIEDLQEDTKIYVPVRILRHAVLIIEENPFSSSTDP